MNSKILIVDDEAPIRRLLEKVFYKEYEVFCAADAFEALEIFKTHNISLVISDQRMPGMSGVELFEEIIKTHRETFRILISGYIVKDELKYAMKNGLIHKFISKPWNLKELKITVAEALKDYRNYHASVV